MRTIPTSLIKDKLYCVNYLVYKNNEGEREFLYIAVRQDQMDKFQQAIKQGNFDAEDYGVILESGKGEAPAHVKEKMKVLYKCDHNSDLSVLDYEAPKDE